MTGWKNLVITPTFKSSTIAALWKKQNAPMLLQRCWIIYCHCWRNTFCSSLRWLGAFSRRPTRIRNQASLWGTNKSCIFAIPLLDHLSSLPFLEWHTQPVQSAMELSSEYPGNRIGTPGDATVQCQGYTVGAEWPL